MLPFFLEYNPKYITQCLPHESAVFNLLRNLLVVSGRQTNYEDFCSVSNRTRGIAHPLNILLSTRVRYCKLSHCTRCHLFQHPWGRFRSVNPFQISHSGKKLNPLPHTILTSNRDCRTNTDTAFDIEN